jgi:hypothetical protein
LCLRAIALGDDAEDARNPRLALYKLLFRPSAAERATALMPELTR